MKSITAAPITPGTYLFRASRWLPTIQVNLVKRSAQSPDQLDMRFLGVTFQVNRLTGIGEWSGPLCPKRVTPLDRVR